MITVRKMVEKDAFRASELEKASFSSPWSEDAFIQTLTKDYASYYVAEENDGIVGMCGLLNMAGEGELTNVSVDEKYRRRGVASMLLAHLFEDGEKLDIKAFTLEVRCQNRAAIHLYEKFGFKIEGIRKNFYEKPQDDAYIMWKR